MNAQDFLLFLSLGDVWPLNDSLFWPAFARRFRESPKGMSLEEERQHQSDIFTLLRIGQLDESWTNHLVAPREIAMKEQEAIEKVADELCELLHDTSASLERMSALATKHSAFLDNWSRILMSHPRTPAPYRHHMDQRTKKHGSLSNAAAHAARSFRALVPKEEEDTRNQVKLFREGKPVRGQLSTAGWCNIAEGALVGGILAIPSAPYLGAFAAGFGIGFLAVAEGC